MTFLVLYSVLTERRYRRAPAYLARPNSPTMTRSHSPALTQTRPGRSTLSFSRHTFGRGNHVIAILLEVFDGFHHVRGGPSGTETMGSFHRGATAPQSIGNL